MTRQKVSIITGASNGLGLALAERLVQEQYSVVGVSRGKSPDPKWVALVANGSAQAVSGSVAMAATATAAFSAAEEIGVVDLVINCAGEGIFGPAGAYTQEDLQRVFEANLIGTILFSERA